MDNKTVSKKKKNPENKFTPDEGDDSGSSSTIIVDPAIVDTFSNHLILKHILNFVDNQNLLKLSLVSKLWCSTARSILRQNRRCLAYVKGPEGKAACKALLRLNYTLSNCQDIPFSGIAVELSRTSVEVDTKEPAYLEDEDLMVYNSSDDSDFEPYLGPFQEFLRTEEGNESLLDSDSQDSTSDAEFVPPEEAPKLKAFYKNVCYDEGEQRRHIYFTSNFPQIYAAILEKIPHRHLQFRWEAKTVCPGQALLVKILQEKGQGLSELKITSFPDPIRFNLREYLKIDQTNWLQNLKVLDWERSHWFKTLPTKIIGELLDAAPNLQRIIGICHLDDLNVLVEKNKSHLVESLGFYCGRNSFPGKRPWTQNHLSKYAESKPRIKKIWFLGILSDTNKEDENIVSVTEHVLKNLLEPVSSFVEEIHLDQSHLMLRLRKCLLQPLEKLQKLYVRLHDTFDPKAGFSTLERLDWGMCFPALKIIEMSLGSKESTNLALEDLQQLTVNFVCLTVTDIVLVQELEITRDYWDVEDSMDFNSLAYLSQLFPNVTNFTLIRAATLDEVLNFLWVSWPNLETITLRHVNLSSVGQNHDEVFCGISKIECLSLSASSVALDDLQIVPTAPSISTLKRLKKFRIEFLNHFKCKRKRVRNLNNLFSELTGKLAFSRMPELTVEIARKMCDLKGYPCEVTFEHLRPFVKLIDEGEGRRWNCY